MSKISRTIRFDPEDLALIERTGEGQAVVVRKALRAYFMQGNAARELALEREARVRAEAKLKQVQQAVRILERTPEYTRLVTAVA